MSSTKPKIRGLWKTLSALIAALTAACSHSPPVRPPCTWKLWAVEGVLVRLPEGERIPCQGPEAGACVGLTHGDFMNLISCGGNPRTRTPSQ
jgi:hypothetical protein